MLVKEIMTKKLFTLREDHKLDLAEDLMNWQRIRHIPVVDESNHLKGLVTHRDLLRVSISSLAAISEQEKRELLEQVCVSDIMRKDPLTIGPDAHLKDAAAIMIDEKVGCLPVVEEGKLVGLITEADFLTLAWDVAGNREVKKGLRDIG